MQTVPVEARIFNPGSRLHCSACNGIGRQGEGVGRSPCASCGGCGSVVVPMRRVEEDCRYIATCGDSTIDEGGPLAPFTYGLANQLELDNEDVVVWKVAEGSAPRLVAYIRPTVGGNQIMWIQ